MGIQLALSGVPFQTFTIPPAQDQTTAQVSFVAALLGENEQVKGVLIGRTDLESNPFTQPVLASLNNMAGLDGQGLLLDENNRILVHSDPNQVMTTFTGRTSSEPLFYNDTGPDGRRQMIYFQPALGRPWSIVLTVPAYRAQQLALTIAAPLLGMILLLALVALIVMRLGLRVVTASLQNLTTEAGRLEQGRLDEPLAVDGEDEVAQLRRAFEQMRASLKARLDELNRLLLVSQGVASSLEMAEAVHPVLEAALATGATSARVILTPAVVPEVDGESAIPMSFGAGPSHNLYDDMDELVLAFTRHQDRLVLSNMSRPRLLNIPPGVPKPESLMAVALRHENLFYGTLWRSIKHTPSEKVRSVTLGGQAALAAPRSLFATPNRAPRLAAIQHQPRSGAGHRPARPAAAG
jgi:HAMP domain-containing protein